MCAASPSSAQRVQLLVLERVEPACNMARYYVLSVELTLFDDAALVREWGRLGSLGGGASILVRRPASRGWR